MKLIFLYGPPATGKLTIAQELSKITSYPVFHNHLTRDLVQNIYPGNLMDHFDLVETLREDVMKYCAAHGTNLIFTFVYAAPDDDEVVAKWVSTIAENGGTVCFVELMAPSEVLFKRVGNESRKQHKIIVDPELLAGLLDSEMFTSVPYDDVLKIDTSTMDPAEAAAAIASHFALV